MITDADIKKLSVVFATKEDLGLAVKESLKGVATKQDLGLAVKEGLKGVATKKDLKGFATKEDLKGFATKDDLRGFATKDDLKALATKDDLKALATKEDVAEVANEVQALKERVDIMEDNLMGEISKLQDENLVTSSYRAILTDHEQRIFCSGTKKIIISADL